MKPMEEELMNSIENPDSQLAAEAQSGDMAAEENLIRKYAPLVMKKARAYFMAGADENDVIQEGMIGLMKAVRKYEPDRKSSFASFAELCITNQIISAIRMADRSKHKPLNSSLSLNAPLPQGEPAEGGGREGMTLADTLNAGMTDTPEEMLILKDVTQYILHNNDRIFSEFEMQVLMETMKGYTYDQVAHRLGKSRKSVDNALQRAKRKIYDYLWK